MDVCFSVSSSLLFSCYLFVVIIVLTTLSKASVIMKNCSTSKIDPCLVFTYHASNFISSSSFHISNMFAIEHRPSPMPFILTNKFSIISIIHLQKLQLDHLTNRIWLKKVIPKENKRNIIKTFNLTTAWLITKWNHNWQKEYKTTNPSEK